MGRLNFFVLWSLREAPRQFISKSNRRCHQVHIPLPLPSHLVVFGLGEWRSKETTVAVEVLVSQDVKPQRIGTLSSQARCLIWEGVWNPELVIEATDRGRKGVYGKILLTDCGEEKSTFISSTPLVPRSHDSALDLQSSRDFSHTLLNTSQQTTLNSSHLGDSVCYAELKADKIEPLEIPSTLPRKRCIWPTDGALRSTVIGKRGHLSWSSEELGVEEDGSQASSPEKKRRMCGLGEMMKRKNPRADRPSKRWCHTMCLSDPDTAIVIGGEASDQTHCKDFLWKLEMENDFWFPMNSSTSGPVPPCARGHSAVYDPESRSIYVYGGLRDGQRYSDLYVLNTLTWKWKLVHARGNVPSLAYHSATFYKKELYVFGGVHPSRDPASQTCSNALYIYNPEFELWYQPIVEGARPLPRFGHSTTLLSDQMIIFGGKKTATYLNDLHILDLGFMEYTAVKYENMPPLPRGFHAALPVAHDRMLVSGGCSTVGTLQDVHIFNVETSMWSSVVSPVLCSQPRAGHSMVHLDPLLTDTEKRKQGEYDNPHCTLLVFGGSDCAGKFHNDIIKCTLDIPIDKSQDVRQRL